MQMFFSILTVTVVAFKVLYAYTVFSRYVDAGTLMNNYAHIFDLLTRLRQVSLLEEQLWGAQNFLFLLEFLSHMHAIDFL